MPEGYIPAWSHGKKPEFESHETLCFLNAGERPAHVGITVFFEDRDPVGPYAVEVPARRTVHLRLNELKSPEPIPKGVNFSTLIVSSEPVVVQHTRLDSRQEANALLSTIAYPAD